jgi:hypothetical protein
MDDSPLFDGEVISLDFLNQAAIVYVSLPSE